MIIAITYPTSIIFWLNYNSKVNMNLFALEVRRLVDLPESYDFKLTMEDAEAIAESFELPLPISIFSPNKNARMDNRMVRTFFRPKHLPENSFVELADDFILPDGQRCRILMEIPELAFVHAALVLDKRETIILGCELCGMYIYDKNSEYGQRTKPIIASKNSISSFISSSGGCRGADKARSACLYISDNANSKVEVFLAVLGSLSFSMGGYNLKPCSLNAKPVLNDTGRLILGKRNIYCDIIWEENKLIAEYDSDLTHLTSEQHQLDKKRANALQESGYRVMFITKNDLATLSNLDQIFMIIRKNLDMRVSADKLMLHKDARRELLAIFRTFESNNISTYLNKGQHM